jgi:hypothetical protein
MSDEIKVVDDKRNDKAQLEKAIAKKPKKIDRSKLAFFLAPDSKDPNILVAADGTRYEKKGGTLKRLSIRPSELPKVKKNGK